MKHPLRRRLMAVLATFTLGVSALFGLLAMGYVHTVEDRFLERGLQAEAARLRTHFAAHGEWLPPQGEGVTLHTRLASLPDDLRPLIAAELRRREAPGTQGRHYHLLALQQAGTPPWLVVDVSRQLVVRPMRNELLGWLLGGGLVLVAVSLLLANALARRISAPLEQLAARVAPGAPGQLPQRLAEGLRDDEIGALARAFDRLLDRTRAFVDREQAFTRDASHELRTPLAVLRLAIERLQADPALPAGLGAQLAPMRAATQLVEQTVHTLLLLAREDGPAAGPTAPTPLLPLVEHWVLAHAAWLDDAGQTLALASLSRQAALPLPPDVLQLALSGLLGNAGAASNCGWSPPACWCATPARRWPGRRGLRPGPAGCRHGATPAADSASAWPSCSGCCRPMAAGWMWGTKRVSPGRGWPACGVLIPASHRAARLGAMHFTRCNVIRFTHAFLATFFALATGLAQARPLAAELRAMLQEQQLAGAVVALVDGSHTQTLALGRFSIPTGQALQPGDRVMVGSVAKTVLALAVLRLVSQDPLELDAPLASVLPQVKLHNPRAARSPVRVRHLLDMTSGLPDLQLWHLFNPAHTADQPLALALRAERGALALRTEPGRPFNYSNLGFTLAAMLVEAVTGEAYESWTERELLRPLGMADSRLHLRSQATDPRLAWGHLDHGQPWAERPVALRPAMQFATTAADMARLTHFLLGDGRLPGPPGPPAAAVPAAVMAPEPFIRTALMAALGRPQGTDAARAGLPSGYGLGFYTRDRHGAVGLCHGGSVAGWRAMLCVFRAQQRGFFIAFNSDREDAEYGRFDARLVQHLAVTTPPVAAVAGDSAAHAAWSGWYVPAPGRLEVLALSDRLFGFWRLRLQPGRATLQEGFAPARPLVPAGDLYRQADRRLPTLALLRGDDGQPRLAGGHVQLRRVSPWALGALWAVAAAGAVAALGLLGLCALLAAHGLWPLWPDRV